MTSESLTFEQAIACYALEIEWPDFIWPAQTQHFIRAGQSWRQDDAKDIKFACDCGYPVREWTP